MYLVPGHKVAIEIYWKGRLDGMATASNKTYLEKQSKAWRCSLIVFLSVCVCESSNPKDKGESASASCREKREGRAVKQ